MLLFIIIIKMNEEVFKVRENRNRILSGKTKIGPSTGGRREKPTIPLYFILYNVRNSDAYQTLPFNINVSASLRIYPSMPRHFNSITSYSMFNRVEQSTHRATAGIHNKLHNHIFRLTRKLKRVAPPGRFFSLKKSATFQRNKLMRNHWF